MGGRGSKSGMGGGYNIKDNMTPRQVDAMHTRLANDARAAGETRDRQMQKLGQSMANGSIPMSQLADKMESITSEYEKKMKAIRKANQELSSKYGVFQSL